ncbi:beta-lactamase, putative [Synechococcus sp. PCC 7335]|uniref:serine hydrolase domain-containing protein n=1 Tax=Synechococcus sp. (strain ATCC 29403 / PCC 7335) TaxID=91464 RepID=UPI00017EC0E1|nr:serine hydrolase domain-containing protein [Synechococcus sp. PCC 7335]EDX82383.1 beta-lactamase, putative [Synechococcus sp. PCC 7335]
MTVTTYSEHTITKAAETTVSTATIENIETYVEQEIARAGLPGGAFAIVAGDEVLVAKGVGIADRATQEPVTSETAYAIGSVAKSFTSTAILQLRDSGLLDLDDPVQQYLPWFQVADKAASAQITIRQLLTHTSGLPGSSHGVVWQDRQRIRPSLEQGVRALKDVHLSSAPGTQFEYANMGYSILGMVVEAVSNQSYDSYLQTQILEPLQMTNSATQLDRVARLDVATPYDTLFGFSVKASPPEKTMGSYLGPAGGTLHSTAADMARYVMVHLGTLPLPNLSETSLTEAHFGDRKIGQNTFYGFAWSSMEVDGVPLIAHNGNTNGSSSAIFLLPEQNIGGILIIGAGTSGLQDQIGLGIVKQLLNQPLERATTYDLWKRISKALLGISIISLLLLIGLGWTIRRQRFRASSRLWILVSRALFFSVLSGLSWWLAVGILPGLFQLPQPFGIYGWSVDLFIGVGLLLLSTTSWAVYSTVVTFRRTKPASVSSQN